MSRTLKERRAWSWQQIVIRLGLATILVLGFLANANLPWRTTLEKQGIDPGERANSIGSMS